MATSKKTFFFGEDHLTAQISEKARKKIRASYEVVARIVDMGYPVYGINTGFGPLCTTKISKTETKILQNNILKSHSVGVGQPIENEIAKLMLVLKAHSLAKGFSGIAEATLDRILWHIDNDAIPIVPSQGSVGASGDLAPLSHLFLPLIGLGKVRYVKKVISTAQL